ncbi:hypothetical protein ACXGQW_00425 [Wenyingzhuangia sp. IMCC45533]
MCDSTKQIKLCTCKTKSKSTYTWKFFKSNSPNKTQLVGESSLGIVHYFFNELAYENKIAYLLNKTEQLFDVEMNIEVDDILLFYKNEKPFLCFMYNGLYEWEHIESHNLKQHELIRYGYIDNV